MLFATSRSSAISGELAGAQLEPLAIRTAFWFSYVSAFPGVELYER